MQLHDRRDDESVIVLGHRGFHNTEKENTIAAFDAAIQAGCDGIELDVHITADNNLVVHHDFSTKRVWSEDLTIETSTLSEIREIASEIPTLAEVLDSMGNIYYDVEIKAGIRYRKELIYLLNDELQKRPQLQDKIMISSFNPLAMRAFSRKMSYEYPLLIIYDATDAVPWFLRRGEGRFLFRTAALKPKCDIAEREKKRLPGYPIIPWTADDKCTIMKMAELRAPMLITNESEIAIRALQEENLR